MVWTGGALKVEDDEGMLVDLRPLPSVYQSERECAVATALLLHDMKLLYNYPTDDDDECEGWIVPEEWERACCDAQTMSKDWERRCAAFRRYRHERVPADVRTALATHITSAQMLHWLCLYQDGLCGHYLSRRDNVMHWRFFVQEV